MGDTISSDYVYFLDSGCSFTILKPSTVVYDIHNIPPRVIEGLTGTRTLTQAATMRLCVPYFNGNPHEIEVTDCLIDPLATVNLVAVKQLNDAWQATQCCSSRTRIRRD
eukprot:1243094-Rhodomonas_salina.1